ncbi:MAG: hypothetical protein O3A00_08165 [Planctomycetota bacterium]|nr:hypothetical protein [Planctomycetota bacterium]
MGTSRNSANRRARRRSQQSQLQSPVSPAEVLEERALLAAWVSQGPSPALNPEVENLTDGDTTTLNDNMAVGAISDVVAHPTNANIVYVGTTNGGVWRTRNAQDLVPTWVPLTDSQSSLSIGAITLDSVNPNKIVAGIGRFSTVNQDGGSRNGLLASDDAGDTWRSITDARLVGHNFVAVTSRGNVMMAASNAIGSGANSGALFRSIDNGVTWFRVSGVNGIPVGSVHDLVADPSNINVYYAAVYGNGIYRSDDSGLTWTNISKADTTVGGVQNTITAATENNNSKLSISQSGRLYVGVLDQGQLAYIGYTSDGGSTWTKMDLPSTPEGLPTLNANGVTPYNQPGDDGSIHFSLVVSPTNEDIVYVGGQEQVGTLTTGNSIGARARTGRLFRGNASFSANGGSPSNQWVHLTHRNDVGVIPSGGTRNGSAPFSGSRAMTFDAAGQLIEVNDGGIYRRTSASTNAGDWFSINGNLSIAEILTVTYDTLNDVIIASSNDLGTFQQTTEGSLQWDTLQYRPVSDVGVDPSSLPGRSRRYRIDGLELVTQEYDSSNVPFGSEIRNPINGLASSGSPFTQLVVNRVDAQRVIVSNGVNSGLLMTNNQGGFWSMLQPTAAPNEGTLIYGGQRQGQQNPNVLYYGESTEVYFTNNITTTPPAPIAGLPGNVSTIRALTVNPLDYATVYVADNDQVFQSIDSGATFIDISMQLQDLGVRDIRTLTYIDGNPNDGIIVTTELGVFVTTQANIGNWATFGTGLPNVAITDTVYDASDDLLIVATLGRGVWTFPFVNNELNELQSPVMISPTGSVESGRPEFRWTGVTNAVSFELLVKNANTGVEVLKEVTTRTNLTPSVTLPEGTYQGTVRAKNIRGDFSDPSNTVTFLIEVPSPDSPVFSSPAAVLTDTTPLFEWSAVPNAENYELAVYDLAGNRVIIQRGLTVTSYEHFAPLAEGTYNARVRAFNNVGEAGPISPNHEFNISVPAPARPDLIGPNDPNKPAETVTLNVRTPTFEWTAAQGAAKYYVWVTDVTRRISGVYREDDIIGTTFSFSSTTKPDTYSKKFPEGTYTWWVKALNESYNPKASLATRNAESSAWLGPFFVTIDLPIPAKVSITSPGTTTTTVRPTFRWTASENVVRYDFWLNRLNAAGTAVLERQVIRNPMLTTTTYPSPKDLIPGRYRLQVKAFNDSNEGVWSDIHDFNVAPPIPTAPTILSPLLNAVGTTDDLFPNFSWTAVANAAYYELWINKIDSQGGLVQARFYRLLPITTTSWEATFNFGIGHFRAWVYGWNEGNQRGISSARYDFEIATATPTTPVIIRPTAGVVNTNSPTLEWTAVANADRYQVYMRFLSTAQVVLNNQNIRGTTYVPDFGLPIGTYQFWVRAINLAGQYGGWSNPVSFVVVSNDTPAKSILPFNDDGEPGNRQQPTAVEAEPTHELESDVTIAALDRNVYDVTATYATPHVVLDTTSSTSGPAIVGEAVAVIDAIPTDNSPEIASEELLAEVMATWPDTDWWLTDDVAAIETSGENPAPVGAAAAVGIPIVLGQVAPIRRRKKLASRE